VLICVFKNEAPFLAEWLQFHRERGVERFYLADNFSDDEPLSVLQPGITEQWISYSKTSTPKMNTRIQARELNKLLMRVKKDYKKAWVMVIDVDEFLFSLPGQASITEILDRFKGRRVATIQVNWVMFGTSHIERLDPQKKMLEQLLWRAHPQLGEHKMGKPIAYLANVDGFLEGPHLPFARGVAQYFYADGTKYLPDKPEIKHEPLRINHYFYRSNEYYQTEKRRKRKAFGDEREGKREHSHIQACNFMEDRTILKLGIN
jgi:hypothetical protein